MMLKLVMARDACWLHSSALVDIAGCCCPDPRACTRGAVLEATDSRHPAVSCHPASRCLLPPYYCCYKAFPSCSTDRCHIATPSLLLPPGNHLFRYAFMLSTLYHFLLGRFGYHFPLQPCCQIVYCQTFVFTVLPLTNNVRQILVSKLVK